ncbi:hypothetical protein [Streptomyces sp. RTGN2]|uniref:hypothetical protein n=1 Tax=Streptomyces sp. RTGN2 TaxID=3016525 RepID=UPI00255428A3|nr:hypothetical protein [Streptomyces sp. RTGN2]
MPATRKPRASRKKPCPDCKRAGQVSETFQVGSRTKHESTDRQEALCLTCFGTGHAPE